MAKQLSDIKKLIERGETDTAINALTNFIGNHRVPKMKPIICWAMPIAKKVIGNKL